MVPSGIRWDKIHGWKRKILKFELKKQHRRIKTQYDMWNKYCGKDVFYVRARMGGRNWASYPDKDTILNHPQFLDRVDDCWYDSYCDFYFELK